MVLAISLGNTMLVYQPLFADIQILFWLFHGLMLIPDIFVMCLFQGFPTHAADGSEITKSQAKKLQKIYDAQAKKYNDYLKSIKDNAEN